MSKVGRKTAQVAGSSRRKTVTDTPEKTGFYQSTSVSTPARISSTYQLLKQTFRLMVAHRRLLGGIVLVYVALVAILARGLNNVVIDVEGDSLNERLASISALSSSNELSGSATVLQGMVFIITGLAIIWALRRIDSRERQNTRVRDAFYKGMTPLVPYCLVLLVIFIQALPFIIFGSVFSATLSDGAVAATVAQQGFWGLLFILSTVWTIYMVSASIQALFLVTEVGATPMESLRRARRLVYRRRWAVGRKVFLLTSVLVLGVSLLALPFALIAPITLGPLFLLYNGIIVMVVFVFFYLLHKELRQ